MYKIKILSNKEQFLEEDDCLENHFSIEQHDNPIYISNKFTWELTLTEIDNVTFGEIETFIAKFHAFYYTGIADDFIIDLRV